MNKILKIEGIKTLNYKTFKTIIILHAILYLLVILIASSIKVHVQGLTIEKVFQFPHIWNTAAWFASWFNLLLGILAITLISNEFSFRTFRKQLIDGLSRNELLFGKVSVLIFLAAYTMLLVFITGLLFGLIKTPSSSLADFVNGLSFLPILYVQALGYMLLAMLFAFIFRNTAFSIVAFILYFFPIEPIIRAFLPSVVKPFMPVKLISNLTPMPDFVGISLSEVVQFSSDEFAGNVFGITTTQAPLFTTTLAAIGYCILFVFISKLIVQKKNF